MLPSIELAIGSQLTLACLLGTPEKSGKTARSVVALRLQQSHPRVIRIPPYFADRRMRTLVPQTCQRVFARYIVVASMLQNRAACCGIATVDWLEKSCTLLAEIPLKRSITKDL